MNDNNVTEKDRKSETSGLGIYRDDMEVVCIRKGYWMVEGYHVENWRQDGKDWWHVVERYADQPEKFLGKRHTLTAAVDLVHSLTTGGAS